MHTHKKYIISLVVTAAIAGLIGFWIGSPRAQRQTVSNRMGGQVGAGSQRMLRGNGFVSGEVVALDAESLTVKGPDGSTRIVFISSSTPVLKSIVGSRAEVQVGARVMITGTSSTDGSIVAQSVQLRAEERVR